MLRPGHATLPSAYLLNYGIRRTLKTKTSPPLLPITSLTGCRVIISPKHKIPQTSLNILHDRSHVLYLPTKKRFPAFLDGRYNERQEGLWIVIISNTLHMKRVVRSWAKRRVDQAVTGALKMKGFDRNGRRMVDPDTSLIKGPESNNRQVNSTMEDEPEAVVGTVEIHILPNAVETSFAEMQRQAGGIVDKILEICGRYSRNRQAYRQQESEPNQKA